MRTPELVVPVKMELDPLFLRVEALRAASTISHGTVGTLLSHAADCERWLRGDK